MRSVFEFSSDYYKSVPCCYASVLFLTQQHDELKDEYTNLSSNYFQVTEKSEEVIRKLQEERDLKIVECEQLRAEVYTEGVHVTVHVLYMLQYTLYTCILCM